MLFYGSRCWLSVWCSHDQTQAQAHNPQRSTASKATRVSHSITHRPMHARGAGQGEAIIEEGSTMSEVKQRILMAFCSGVVFGVGLSMVVAGLIKKGIL